MFRRISDRITQRYIETAALIIATGLEAVALPLAIIPAGSQSAWRTGVAIAFGLLGADFLSGVVHWIGDTWGDTQTPVLGKTFIASFREHHVDQTAITRHDFIETNGSAAVGVIPLLLLALALPGKTAIGQIAIVALGSSALFLISTNQIHKWAHCSNPPLAVRLLQRLRLILSPSAHAVHHRAPFDQHYCITTGWLNHSLAAPGVFRAAEAVITRVTGSVARHMLEPR